MFYDVFWFSIDFCLFLLVGYLEMIVVDCFLGTPVKTPFCFIPGIPGSVGFPNH